MQQKPPPRQIRLELPANMNATYANAVIINQTHSEIILDFIQVLPSSPTARVQSRIVMTPANAKAFLQALKINLERFEEKHGEIELPQPPTLADQLFGAVRPEDNNENQDTPENG